MIVLYDEEKEMDTPCSIIRSHNDYVLTHPLLYLLLDRTMAIYAECTLLPATLQVIAIPYQFITG